MSGEQFALLAAVIAIGIASALALTRLMTHLLFGVGATDPATFRAVALVLAVTSLLASYIPAQRAMKVDPIEALACPVAVPGDLFRIFQLAFFWCIGRTRKLNTIAIRVSKWHNPQTVPHGGAVSRLNTPRFELAIKRECVFAHEAYRSACSKRFLRPTFRHELLKHDRGLAKFKPAPANFAVSRIFFISIRNPLALDCESEPINIEPQRRFHLGYTEKRYRLFNIRACGGFSGHDYLLCLAPAIIARYLYKGLEA
jgi:hypothetical protein